MRLLPPSDGKTTRNVSNAINIDIIDTIHKNFETSVEQTKLLAQKLKGETHLQTARKVWRFLKQVINYKKDDDQNQDIRLPNRFLDDRIGDCKSYALLANSIFANLGMPAIFRYASYSNSPTPTHVYAVTQDEKGNEIICDGVYNQFNKEKQYTHKHDYQMNVNTLSGIGSHHHQQKTYLRRLIAAYHHAKNPTVKLLVKRELQRLHGAKLANGFTLYTIRKILKDAGARTLARHLARKEYLLMQPGANDHIRGIGDIEEMHGLDGIGRLRLKRLFKKLSLKKVFDGLKKIALAPARNAYLTLVKFNVRGLAHHLSKVPHDKLSAKWRRLGGNPRALYRQINKGKHKHPMLGGRHMNGIGNPAAVASILVAAAPVIASLSSLIKQFTGGGSETATDENGKSIPGSSYDDLIKSAKEEGGNLSFPSGAVVTDSTPGAGEGAGVPTEEDIKQEQENEQTGFHMSTPVKILIGAGIVYGLTKSK